MTAEDCDHMMQSFICKKYCLLSRWSLSTALNITQCNGTDTVVKHLMTGKK